MTDGFGASLDHLPASGAELAAAASGLICLGGPLPDAGRSTDEVAATVQQVLSEAGELGDRLTALGQAFADAAREYAAADAAVVDSLVRWRGR